MRLALKDSPPQGFVSQAFSLGLIRLECLVVQFQAGKFTLKRYPKYNAEYIFLSFQ
jgi:hypothetical protein